jgi:hypothetical protein
MCQKREANQDTQQEETCVAVSTEGTKDHAMEMNRRAAYDKKNALFHKLYDGNVIVEPGMNG